MTYADYAYYAGIYVGSVSEEDFSRLAVRASSFLDYYTQNRAKDNAELDAVKMCCCALIDQYALLDAAQKAATKSLANAGGRQLFPHAHDRWRSGKVCAGCGKHQ